VQDLPHGGLLLPEAAEHLVKDALSTNGISKKVIGFTGIWISRRSVSYDNKGCARAFLHGWRIVGIRDVGN
jgi:hypothetical protein